MPTWFQDAKFGIFIHWGVYSVPAWRKVTQGRYASYAEWYYARVMFDKKGGGQEFHAKNFGEDFAYRDFVPLFRAELFDPEQWTDLFARSGAKYVVLTSKHHDGFCLWPTKSLYKKGWNSMDIGPKRDLVGNLTTAVRKKGLRMGLYYSIIEWESNWNHRTETGYFIPKKLVDKHGIPEDKYIDHHMIPQLKELVMAYEPAVIFGDAIYRTRSWEGAALNREKEESRYFTQKGNDLFVICTEWPQQEFVIQGIRGSEKTQIKLLGADVTVQWQMMEDGLSVKPPVVTPATIPCDYAWVFHLSDVLR